MAAEVVEGRGRAKGNPVEQNMLRTQCRVSTPSALDRIRQAAKRNKRQQFTAFMHHIYEVDCLRRAYYALKRDAAAGVDGQTWRTFCASSCRFVSETDRRADMASNC
ncbi:MAG: hypothetical protein JXA30_04905 [Deltaproteobacteria bacterium]|nr:hypothetical protein [Deltaproteobacteria bacterium]